MTNRQPITPSQINHLSELIAALTELPTAVQELRLAAALGIEAQSILIEIDQALNITDLPVSGEEMSDAQRKRIETEMSKVAGHRVTAEKISSALYFHCAEELGMYRIVNHYRSMFDRLRYGFSRNLNTWYVSYEPRFKLPQDLPAAIAYTRTNFS